MSTASSHLSWRDDARRRRLSIDLDSLKDTAPLVALLSLTAVLYLWALSRNGWANEYYAAAVQAGTHSWKAFLFGSLDASNYITVDKPPASLWVMELAGRLFGFSSFTMLLPQALEGVAAVALLYAAVRRWFGRPAALLSGLILALTPVAALMFRFNNPDALLVLLLVAGAYTLTRAVEDGSTRWLALTAAVLGFAFLTKELQAFLVLPAFALVYLVAAPVRLRRRVWQLAVAGATLLVSAGWWVALVELWPASARPYIGGSTNNSILQLIFGYNGLERISSGAGAGGAGGFSGAAGSLRLFNSILGGQISWLLPAAAIALVAGFVWTARRSRTDRTRAALLLWGGWLVVTAIVFSFMTGVIHPYYMNTLAPPIAALVGCGSVVLWRRRESLAARLTLGAMLIVTGVWAYILLDRTPDWHPWLRSAILVGTLVAGAAILAGSRLRGAIRGTAATLGLVAALAGPTAYTLATVASTKTGQNPTAGPASVAAAGFGGGFPGRAGASGPPAGAGAFGPPAGGGASGAPASAGASGAPAGTGGSATASRELVALLDRDSSRYTWVAATTSWQTAASIELAGGKAVMDIGGFSGTDGMTLARLESLVAEGKIHYYVSGGGGFGSAGPGGFGGGFAGRPAGGGGGPGGRSAAASEIQSWVAAHFTSTTVGGTTVYDLAQPKEN